MILLSIQIAICFLLHFNFVIGCLVIVVIIGIVLLLNFAIELLFVVCIQKLFVWLQRRIAYVRHFIDAAAIVGLIGHFWLFYFV